jgi:hypothetical protein
LRSAGVALSRQKNKLEIETLELGNEVEIFHRIARLVPALVKQE